MDMESESPILGIMELANMTSVPMAVNAIVRLNVADAIWHGGANAPLSAAEILSAAGLPTANPLNLERILRLLTSYGVFNEYILGDGSQRKYSLTDVGKTLASDENGLSYGAYILQHHQEALMQVLPLMHEVVLDSSSEPFVKVHGETAYTFYGKNPTMNVLMQKAMSGASMPFMNAFLERYDGFHGVHTLVDVGGNTGDCLKMIMTKHPNIKRGINFDFPEVVAKASAKIPGLTHEGGDMRKSIPSGDAIFMKWVMVIFTDQECKQIMQNCYDALPAGGKVIACEPVLPDLTKHDQKSRALLGGDIFVMTIYNSKGKHRTQKEYNDIAISVGFSHGKAVFLRDHYFTVLEFHK